METLYRKVSVGSKVKFKKMPNSRTKDFTIGKDYEIVKIDKDIKTFLFDNQSTPKFGIRNDKGIIKWFIFSDVWFYFDKSDNTETLENALHQIEKLKADKIELLEALESVKPALRYFPEKLNEIESLIQKHKTCDIK